jgi:hypothetical protein
MACSTLSLISISSSDMCLRSGRAEEDPLERDMAAVLWARYSFGEGFLGIEWPGGLPGFPGGWRGAGGGRGSPAALDIIVSRRSDELSA